MNISFIPLAESHFPLLLKWLESPHVKKWWDQNLIYTVDLVKEKYGDYVKGYKEIEGFNKPMQAYIICLDNQPSGYIQIYNVNDFPRNKPLIGLPDNLGGIDVFIGEKEYLGKGLCSQIITKFLDLHAKDYSYVFVDPNMNNISAIKAYEKAGFQKVSEQLNTQEVWMLWRRKSDMEIRQLAVIDWEAWKQFRLEALKNAPEAFCSSYEEEVNWLDAQFQDSLGKNDIFGIFLDGEMIVGAGFYALSSYKTRHRGVIWGMYTRPKYRGKGYASAVLKRIIEHAKMSVSQLHLACTASNLSAMALYKNHGFKIYGTEPRSLKINQQFLDQYLMIFEYSEVYNE